VQYPSGPALTADGKTRAAGTPKMRKYQRPFFIHARVAHYALKFWVTEVWIFYFIENKTLVYFDEIWRRSAPANMGTWKESCESIALT
jgi:hypothetical protein